MSPGFERPEEVLTFRVSIPLAELPEATAALQAHERIFDALRRLPGVVSVAATSALPMEGRDSNDAVYVEDFPTPEGQLPPIRRFKFVSGDYFETLGTELLAGRTLSWSDIEERRSVAVISENMARELWGSPQAALGKRMRDLSFESETDWRQVVGVVAGLYDDGVSRPAPEIVYWPMVMRHFWEEELYVECSLGYAIRVAGVEPTSLLPEARLAVWSVNGNLPLAAAGTLDELLGRSLARTSFTLTMLAIAATVAVLLGMVGIYGVLSYVVGQRTREIGVRMALGARRADVSGMMVAYGLRLAGAGLLVGLLAAFGLTRMMAALLFGVGASDPVTYVSVAPLLGLVTLVASYVAARRAAGVDPNVALRAE